MPQLLSLFGIRGIKLKAKYFRGELSAKGYVIAQKFLRQEAFSNLISSYYV